MTKVSDRLAAMSSQKARPRSIIWTIARRIAMVIVLVLAFLLSATVTIYVLFRSGDTRVPNLLGRPEAEARKMAEDAGLKVKIQMRSDDKIPASTVIETRPGPNSSVKKDSTLTIYVSSGPSATRSQLISRLLINRSLLKGQS